MFRPNQRVSVTTVREVVVRNANTDILFVVDDSGSMAEEQANLIRNTALFLGELSLSENDYRVGVITTNALDEDSRQETTLGTDGGRLRLQPASQNWLRDPNGGNCGDTITANPGDKPYLVRPPLDATDLDAQRCRLVEDFRQTIASLGTNGSGREAGLLAMKKALEGGAGPVAEHNAGFLRDDADLAVVFLTDEDDCSFADYGEERWPNPTCYQQEDQAIPAAQMVSFLADLKADTAGIRKVRAALIAGGAFRGQENPAFIPSGCRLEAGQLMSECGCWTSTDESFFCEYLQGFDHPCASTDGCQGGGSTPGPACASVAGGSCDTLRCEALPGKRYHQFISELGTQRTAVGFPRGTYEDSICQQEYDVTLSNIARTVVLSSCFTLEEPVVDASLVDLRLVHTDPDTGAVTERQIPWLDASNATADCGSCADTACAEGAWRLEGENNTEICLACDLKKDTGDDFRLTVLSEVYGFEDGGTN